MPLNGSPQITRNVTGPRGLRSVVDAKVRDGDRYDVGLGRDDELRMNCPDTGVREVEGTFHLALVDPLEVANDVRVTRTGWRDCKHSHETRVVIRQNINDHIE